MDYRDEIKSYEQLIESKVGDKYDAPGVYVIYIDESMAYIGKSKEMKQRIANHLFHINHPELKEGKAHKYEILRQAINNGHQINFNFLARNIKDDELGWIEGELIRGYKPPLNYQIPREDNWHKYTTNTNAKRVSLNEIVKGVEYFGDYYYN